MKAIMLIILVILICIIFGLVTNRKNKNQYTQINKERLKNRIAKIAPQYKVREKYTNTIMLCEYNHRNEAEEKAFIILSNVQKKEIKHSQRMTIFTYPMNVKISEIKKDLKQYKII